MGVGLLAACLLAPDPACAGAWTLAEGRSQLILAATATQAPGRFDRRGRPLPTGRFSKQETALQAEYGLSDRLTLLAGGVMRAASPGGPPAGHFVLSGGLSAGVRARIWSDGASVVSLQATVAGGSERTGAGLRSMEAPAEAEARMLYGAAFSLGGMPSFAEAQVGYRWRGGGNADELHLDATLGIRPSPRLLLLLQSFNAMATQADRRFGGGAMRRHKLQPSLVWELNERWSLQIGLFATVAGRETAQERGMVAAVWRRF